MKIILINVTIIHGENVECDLCFQQLNEDVLTMCVSCDETSRIFSVGIVTQEPVSNNMDLYKEIAKRLFENKVISLINVGNNRAYVDNEKQIFGFDLHLTNRHDASKVTLTNVENALDGLLVQFEGYSEMQIDLKE